MSYSSECYSAPTNFKVIIKGKRKSHIFQNFLAPQLAFCDPGSNNSSTNFLVNTNI